MDNKDLEYLYNLERFGVKMGLEVMKKLLAVTGHPEKKWPSIHVVGTSGKGSTAHFLSSALQAGGHKVGLYTSPHIYSFNERIRVNGQEITDAKLATLTQTLRSLVEEHNIRPTFFEFTTALAFMSFAEENIDIAVIEVGLGGPLDATNVISPLVTVITNIGLDHTDILGTTTTAIAKQEAAVIKENIPVVTAEQDPKIIKLFKDKCNRQNSSLHIVQDNFNIKAGTADLQKQSFTIDGVCKGKITIPLLGYHQIINACTALLTLNLLSKQGIVISLKDIKQGFARTRHEGRLDIVSTDPLVIVDGAHNADGVHALADWLRSIKRYDVLILASKKGNDLSAMMNEIVPLFSHVIVTQGNFLPEDTRVIAQKIKEPGKSVQEIPSVREAIEAGNKLMTPKSTMLITGSLYMISDALAILRQKK